VSRVFRQRQVLYSGLFKPRDGVDGLLDFLDVGIAVLDVIPAMRNKFHTTDEIGPQSQAKQVSGTMKRTIQRRFDVRYVLEPFANSMKTLTATDFQVRRGPVPAQ
jgi:hypothetical protein